MTAEKTHRISVPAGLYRQLNEFADDVGKPVSWVVCQLVEMASWDNLRADIEDGLVE